MKRGMTSPAPLPSDTPKATDSPVALQVLAQLRADSAHAVRSLREQTPPELVIPDEVERP
jgi:hypothetical protein